MSKVFKKPVLKIWEIDDGEQHWYSAHTRSKAIEMHFDTYRCPKTGKIKEDDLPCSIEELETRQLDNLELMSVTMDDGTVVEKTAWEWGVEGEGLVASTAY